MQLNKNMRFTDKQSKTALLAFMILNGLSFTAPLFAYEFTKDFRLPVITEFDDNVTLSKSNKVSAIRFIATPKITLSSLNDINSFYFGAGINFVRSTDTKNINDREDPSFDMGWNHVYEKGIFSLTGNYTRSSTRTSELIGSGLIFNDGTSTQKGVRANISYMLNERFTTTFNVGYTQQEYTNIGTSTTLYNYDTKTYGARLSYLNNEKLTTFLDYGFNDLKSDNTLNSSKSNRASVGFDYAYSPKLDLMVTAGANRISNSDTGWIGESSLTYQMDDYASLTASIGRSISPSGLGAFQKADRFNIDYKRSLNDYDDVGANFNWNINRTINSYDSKNFSIYYNRELTEDWSLRGTAMRRTISGSGADAVGHQIGVSVIYNNLNF
jgi:hypothetical protein